MLWFNQQVGIREDSADELRKLSKDELATQRIFNFIEELY